MGRNKFEEMLLQVLLFKKIAKRARRKKRCASIQIFFNRSINGEIFLVKELADDPEYHHKYFRMNKDNFDEILSLVSLSITKNQTHARPISALEKLAITIRYLATGNSQISLGLNYRISPSSVSVLLRETIESICKIMGPRYLPIPTSQTWTENEKAFRSRWNFPNCCGSVDGKHIRIRSPAFSTSTHFNYKHFFSIVLMAVADADYKFTFADIGAAGSQSDGGVFARSSIGIKLNNGTLDLPQPKLVGDDLLPIVFVGDDALPLKANLMKPYPGKFLTKEKRIFNYRQSRARMPVENSFGILAARWRILHTAINAELQFAKKIVQATVILHNYLKSKKDMNNITADTIRDGEITARGNWRDEAQLAVLNQQGSNNHTAQASQIREKLCSYFNTIGAVNWQESCI